MAFLNALVIVIIAQDLMVNGNISANPLFQDIEQNNFELLWQSPCIDAGNPNSDLDLDGTIADLGYQYFHQIEGVPPAPTNLRININPESLVLEWDIEDVNEIWLYNLSTKMNTLQSN